MTVPPWQPPSDPSDSPEAARSTAHQSVTYPAGNTDGQPAAAEEGLPAADGQPAATGADPAAGDVPQGQHPTAASITHSGATGDPSPPPPGTAPLPGTEPPPGTAPLPGTEPPPGTGQLPMPVSFPHPTGHPAIPQIPGDPATTPQAPQATSGDPATLSPYGPAPAARPRSRWTLTLAITTLVFFVLFGVMAGLYVDKRSELEAADRDIRDLRIALRDSQKALRKNKADLEDSQEANRALSRCADEVVKAFDKLDRTGQANITRAKSACNRARPYID